MIEAKHTPGPWKFRAAKNYLLATIMANGKLLAIFSNTISDEDGRLMAAAPDLLEALKEAQQNWHHMIGLSSPAEHHRLNDRMSAAIAKATGEQDA